MAEQSTAAGTFETSFGQPRDGSQVSRTVLELVAQTVTLDGLDLLDPNLNRRGTHTQQHQRTNDAAGSHADVYPDIKSD